MPTQHVDRSPGPEGTYLRHQTSLLVKREVETVKPSQRSLVNHYHRSFVGRSGECVRDLCASDQGSSYARASEDAFLACEVRNLQVWQVSSTVGRHNLMLERAVEDITMNRWQSKISDHWKRTEAADGNCPLLSRIPDCNPSTESRPYTEIALRGYSHIHIIPSCLG